MKAVVYRINNLITGHSYVGATQDFYKRKYNHLWGLRKGVHKSKNLQAAFDRFGEAAFDFEILEEVKDKSNLSLRENYYIKKLDPAYNYYGIDIGFEFTRKEKEWFSKRASEYLEDTGKEFLNKKEGMLISSIRPYLEDSDIIIKHCEDQFRKFDFNSI